MVSGFVLVLSLLTAEGNRIEVVKDVFPTIDECNQYIFEERIFNGACIPADKVISKNANNFAVN